MQFNHQKQIIIVVILFALFFILYSLTAAPGVYDGDSGEISAGVLKLGLLHLTGFPLYALTGRLFISLIPFGEPAFGLNIFSALVTAATVSILFFALQKFNISTIPSISTSAIFGLGQTIWSHAGTAQVYSLTLLFATILFYLFF